MMAIDLSKNNFLSLEGASRWFGSVAAVELVSLTIAVGSFTSIVGPSGCGKTTLLRMMGGLEPLDAGRMERSLGALSYCFQEPRLLPWRSVVDNVALPLELNGVPREERLDRAYEAIARVQLSEAAGRFPHQLSGGMKMRVAIARALIASPALLLLDEPFGALDEVTRHELDAELRALWEREQFTAVIVTHSMQEAAFLSERILVCSPRPARIIAEVATSKDSRDARYWTSTSLNAAVRTASDAMATAIEALRR
jgi:NitT/TauT family transport system ATP-binding protein